MRSNLVLIISRSNIKAILLVRAFASSSFLAEHIIPIPIMHDILNLTSMCLDSFTVELKFFNVVSKKLFSYLPCGVLVTTLGVQ